MIFYVALKEVYKVVFKVVFQEIFKVVFKVVFKAVFKLDFQPDLQTTLQTGLHHFLRQHSVWTTLNLKNPKTDNLIQKMYQNYMFRLSTTVIQKLSVTAWLISFVEFHWTSHVVSIKKNIIIITTYLWKYFRAILHPWLSTSITKTKSHTAGELPGRTLCVSFNSLVLSRPQSLRQLLHRRITDSRHATRNSIYWRWVQRWTTLALYYRIPSFKLVSSFLVSLWLDGPCCVTG